MEYLVPQREQAVCSSREKCIVSRTSAPTIWLEFVENFLLTCG